MIAELVTRAVCTLIFLLVCLRFGPPSPARRPAPAPRIYRRQLAAVGKLPTGRIYAVRVQLIVT
jgi:hypothetical protein